MNLEEMPRKMFIQYYPSTLKFLCALTFGSWRYFLKWFSHMPRGRFQFTNIVITFPRIIHVPWREFNRCTLFRVIGIPLGGSLFPHASWGCSSPIGLKVDPYTTHIALLYHFTIEMLSLEMCYLPCEACLLPNEVCDLPYEVCCLAYLSYDFVSCYLRDHSRCLSLAYTLM